jgi:hypothetical protein
VGIISKNNLIDTIWILMHYNVLLHPYSSNEISGAIPSTCNENVYELVVDFGWYVYVLGDIGRISQCQHDKEVERNQQMLESNYWTIVAEFVGQVGSKQQNAKNENNALNKNGERVSILQSIVDVNQ